MLSGRNPHQVTDVNIERASDGTGESAPSRLMLFWEGREYIVVPGSVFVLGNAPDTQLKVPGEHVSGYHATIEYPLRGHRFELVDHSTNGTLIQTEDEQVRRVHRDRVPMWGEGWLSLGTPFTTATALRYSHV